MTYTREQQQVAYKKLPQEARDLIMSWETTELVTSSLKNTGLDEAQVNYADSEILYAMYGLQNLDASIEAIAKLSSKKVEDFSQLKRDLEENIFSKLKNMSVAEKNIKDENKKIPSDPVIITPETKKAMIQELSQRVEAARQGGASVKPTTFKPIMGNVEIEKKLVPEIAPEIHPMTKKEEEVHEVPHIEPTISNQQPVVVQPQPKPAQDMPQPTSVTVEPTLQNSQLSTPLMNAQSNLNSLPKPSNEKKPTAAPSNPRSPHYPGGADPYREPLQ